ncbi:MAG: hypothetical protein IKW21_06755 [Lachnospiraceae bacterium]|nr:hypothetical protein [Lachnospiraceae bacterium]
MSIRTKLQTIRKNNQKIRESGGITDEFWRNTLNGGNAKNYKRGFCTIWNDDNFKPTYDIVLSGDNDSIFWGSQITDFSGILQRQGVRLDTSGATILSYAFATRTITTIPEIDCRNLKELTHVFRGATSAVSIALVMLKEDGTQTFESAFLGCGELKDISISGTIGNDISFKDSTKLSQNSIVSIVLALSDSVSGKTLTLSRAAKEAAFTDEEWNDLIEFTTNWTFNLV